MIPAETIRMIEQEANDRAAARVPERLNPLLKLDALRAADEAACRLDGMFRDLFNDQERLDLIVTIIRAATTAALGLPQPSSGGSQ
jgi:hypothetical protein